MVPQSARERERQAQDIGPEAQAAVEVDRGRTKAHGRGRCDDVGWVAEVAWVPGMGAGEPDGVGGELVEGEATARGEDAAALGERARDIEVAEHGVGGD